MKTKALMIALALGFAPPAMAQKVVYACQYFASAGLNWENGKWVTSRFHTEQPFFLASENGALQKNTVAKFFNSLPESVFCHRPNSRSQTCSDTFGDVLTFSVESMNGTYATTFGGTQNSTDRNKDSVAVSPFTCTKVE